jgi:hypothetical protein
LEGACVGCEQLALRTNAPSTFRSLFSHRSDRNNNEMSNSSTDDDNELDELFMLLLSLETLTIEVEEFVQQCESNLSQHINEQRRLNWSLSVDKLRPRWDSFSSRLLSTHFRIMFRMNEEGFATLCTQITAAIGEKQFRLEAFLDEKKEDNDLEDPFNAPIPGEVKVAIAIRMLAGGSYLDLVPLFLVSSSHLA